jgi:hypothetical protein
MAINEEYELVELQLQNAASWQVFASAQDQRDFVAKLHGGSILLLSLIVDQTTKVAATLAGAATLAVLAAVSFQAATLSISYRSLQFYQYSAERASRTRLTKGDSFLAALIDSPEMVALRLQRDPMGSHVRTMRWIAVVDCGLLGGYLAMTPMISFSVLNFGDAQPVEALSAAAVAFASGVAAALALNKEIRRSERLTNVAVVERYKAIGILEETEG